MSKELVQRTILWLAMAAQGVALGGCGGDVGQSSTVPQTDAGGAVADGPDAGSLADATGDVGLRPGVTDAAEAGGDGADLGPFSDAGPSTDAAGGGDAAGQTDGGPEAGVAAGVHAVGNQLFDGAMPLRLLGVSRAGTEYQCIHGVGFFDGPNDQASITAMLAWKVNAVRIPLNEDCWLAVNTAGTSAAAYAGSAYQRAVLAYVNLLLKNGIYPILDLHWTAPGTQQALGQFAMPDVDHSVTFWTQVASAYAAEPRVILELFNEPFPDNNMEAAVAWACWRDGSPADGGVGPCVGLASLGAQGVSTPVTYRVAGMQTLLDTVRNAGATNFVLLGGLEYSNDLRQWLQYAPTNRINNIGAAWHIYDGTTCSSTTCYSAQGGPVAAKVPVVATEIGALGSMACTGGGATFMTSLMDWLDSPGPGIPALSYLGWAWNTNVTPSLVSDYAGTPNCYGATFRSRLLTTPH